jgi:hypothetical protein
VTRIGCLGPNEACRAGIGNLAHGGEDGAPLANLIRAASEPSQGRRRAHPLPGPALS